MDHMPKNIVILLLAAALMSVIILQRRSGPPAPDARFDEIRSILVSSPLTGAATGFCLLDAAGNVVVDAQAQTAFIPASALKTLTTATALEMLGPEFRFTTELQSTAPLQQGIIHGDVSIAGGGDPMLSMSDLEAWAAELKKRGLKRVTGTVLGGSSLFPGSLYGDFWNWGDIGNGYASGVAGLNLDHNRYSAFFAAGTKVGDAATFLSARPEVPGISWINEVRTGTADSGDGVVIHGGEGTSVIHLRGTVPLGAKNFTVTGAVPTPGRFAAFHLRRLLIEAGIQIDDGTQAPAPVLQTLLKHQSPPLLEIVRSIHATSDNHETECVFRMLGLKAGKAPAQVIREHWKARGLDFVALRMEDGCGLARADFIRPLDLARLQFFAGKGPHAAAYKASLLGDGILRSKGGAMSGVRTLTGFITSQSGQEFCFAFMVNHFTGSSAVAELRQRLIEAMAKL